MYCSKCGKELTGKERVCSKCGNEMPEELQKMRETERTKRVLLMSLSHKNIKAKKIYYYFYDISSYSVWKHWNNVSY